MFNVTHNWPTPTTATATATASASANNKSNNCGTNNSNNAARTPTTTQTVAHNEFLSNCKIKICNQYSAQMCARCLSVSFTMCVCKCMCVRCAVGGVSAAVAVVAGAVKGHYQLITKCTMYDVQMMYVRLYHMLE